MSRVATTLFLIISVVPPASGEWQSGPGVLLHHGARAARDSAWFGVECSGNEAGYTRVFLLFLPEHMTKQYDDFKFSLEVMNGKEIFYSDDGTARYVVGLPRLFFLRDFATFKQDSWRSIEDGSEIQIRIYADNALLMSFDTEGAGKSIVKMLEKCSPGAIGLRFST